MKIYSSELLNSSMVDSGNLTITTGDQIIVADNANGVYENTITISATADTFTTDPTQGLFVTGGTFDTRIRLLTGSTPDTLNTAAVAYHYLDGKGQQRQLNDVLVAKGTLSGSTLRFLNRGDVLLGTADLSGLSGGGGGAAASTNDTNNILPVRSQDDLLSPEFVDSSIIEVGTFVTPTTTAGAVNGAVTTGSMAVIDGIASGDRAGFHTRFSSGVASTTIDIGGTRYDGTLTSTDSGATATFTLASGTFTGSNELADNAIVTLPLVAGSRTVTGLRLGAVTTTATRRSLEVTGDLTVRGTTTTVNSTTVDVADRYLSLGTTGTTSSGAAVAEVNSDGGLIVEASSTDDGSAIAKTYGGLRYNGEDNVWEVSSDPGSDGLAAGATWTPLSTAGGTTNKAVLNVSSANALTGEFDGTAITTIAAADATVTDVAASTTAGVSYKVAISLASTTGRVFPIGNTDVTVAVYDGGLQIIPDEVALNRFDNSSAADVTTTTTDSLTVYLPQDYSPSALKIVIIG